MTIKLLNGEQETREFLDLVTCGISWLRRVRGWCPLELVYVPGHTGYQWNEEADNLAKKGAHGQWTPTGRWSLPPTAQSPPGKWKLPDACLPGTHPKWESTQGGTKTSQDDHTTEDPTDEPELETPHTHYYHRKTNEDLRKTNENQ